MIESFLTKYEILFHKDVLMKNYTTMGIGGYAPFIVTPRSFNEVLEISLFAKKNNVELKIIGNGSNLIVDDKNFHALFLCPLLLKEIEIKNDNVIEAGAGISLNSLSSFAAKNGLAGFEWAAGIPGSTGGAVKMNAGAFHFEIKDAVASLTVLNSQNEIQELTHDELAFQYRKSFLNPSDIVLKAAFQFTPDDPFLIQSRIKEFQHRRIATQPLAEKSAGCIFKNPPGNSAGKCIDQLGLKGYRIGGAVVSEKHANFIVNRYNATFGDTMLLIDYIKDKVNKNYNIELENEVEIWYA